MAFNYIVDAIQLLDPKAEFIIEGNDYSTIQWQNLSGEAPTAAQIDAAIEQVKANELAAETKKESDRLAAQAKLEALGLTPDDLKALGL